GAAAQLECEIAGTAPFDISWLKNKKPITGDHKYKIISQDSLSRLEIQTFESADIGDYQCVVSNDVGKVTTKASAKLKEPPSFSKRIESVTAVLGNAVKLQGTIKGSAPITVKWMKDSEILRDDDPNIKMVFENNVASLSITAVAINHGGKYSCQAENQGKSLIVTAGDSATLECTISGSPELKVKWFKDGKEMISGRKYKMTLKDNVATMKILTAEKGDTSEYKMEVSNKVGKDQCTCSVTVLEPPVFVRKLDATKLVTSGVSIRLECKVSGSPVISFKWFKDEMEISSSPKYTISVSDVEATLEILNCATGDSGDYVCVASSEAGSDRCSSTVTVKEPPVFVRSLEAKDVVKGSEMMLEGQVSGSAPFTVSFYKNTKAIRNDKRHKITVKDDLVALQVQAVEAGDVGLYQCTVENEVGLSTCECQMTLKEPPSFVKKLENVSSLVGSDVSLQCTLKGSEPITVTWLKDNHELKEAENVNISYENKTALLHINGLHNKHGGKYSCQAQNQAGSQTCSAVLTVKGRLNLLILGYTLIL
uniref:Ig-like domain-containing protein n=1 Tax=Poecilia mexicana TaxID=48701 RepID=A0A3B3YUD1_9TELE